MSRVLYGVFRELSGNYARRTLLFHSYDEMGGSGVRHDVIRESFRAASWTQASSQFSIHHSGYSILRHPEADYLTIWADSTWQGCFNTSGVDWNV